MSYSLLPVPKRVVKSMRKIRTGESASGLKKNLDRDLREEDIFFMTL